MSPDEKAATQVCIVDEDGLILADTEENSAYEKITFSKWDEVRSRGLGFTDAVHRGRSCTVGFALSPGYETYRTGWYSLLLQRSDA